MDGTNDATIGGGEQNGRAIGDAYGDEPRGIVGDEGIGLGIQRGRMVGFAGSDDVHRGTVDLVDLDDAAIGRFQFAGDCRDVGSNVC